MKDNNIKFIYNTFTKKTNILDSFEKNKNDLSFEKTDEDIWTIFIIKSSNENFEYLLPLSFKLLEEKLYIPNKLLLEFAILNAYKLSSYIEQVNNNFQEMNKHLEKTYMLYDLTPSLTINQKVQPLLSLFSKIIENASEELYQKTMEEFNKKGIPFHKTSFFINIQNSKKPIKKNHISM